MNLTSIAIFAVVVVALVVILGYIATRYKRIQHSGEALIINTPNGKKVSFTGTFVWPVINQLERIDITRKNIPVIRQGKDGLPCKDNIRANINVEFYISVNANEEDVKLVASNFTCEGASDINVLNRHFGPKFAEALKTVVKQFDFEDLYTNRMEFRDAIKKHLGQMEKDQGIDSMDGFKLQDVAVESIDMAPLKDHDPDNILDADGIKKIVERTSVRNIETSEIKQRELTETKKRTVDGENSRLQLERTLQEESAKTKREIEIVQIAEENAVNVRRQEARLEVEKARIKTDQEIDVQDENKNREVEVARINNEKVVEIQREQVSRARQVAKVETDREVAKTEIDSQKIIEGEKKEIADIIAIRTKTERSIAEQEEETSNLRTEQEANRKKLVLVVDATAKAEANAKTQITASEAALAVSKNDAEVETIKANARLVNAEKDAAATRTAAEAARVEKAAVGLAEADVRARIAEVAEQESAVEAERIRITGLAQTEVKSKEVEVTQKQSVVEADRIRATGLATAESERARYEAMGSIAPEVRSHEIDKLNIEKDRDIQLAQIEAQSSIATRSAEVMAEAMKSADISILGDASMLQQIKNSVSAGRSIDARVDSSEILTSLFGKYQTGERDLVADVKDILENKNVSGSDVGSLMLAQSVASLLNKSTDGAKLISQFMGNK